MDLTIDQALQQAISAHRAGKLPDAERLYQAILRSQPRHPDANHNLGVLAVAVGKPALGLPHLKVALEADPKQAQYWLSYIDALLKSGLLESAGSVLQQGRKIGLAGPVVDRLEQQLALASVPVADHVGSSEIAVALSLREAGQYGEAQALLQGVLATSPGDAEAWSLLCQVYLLENKVSQAQDAYEKAMGIAPGLASVSRNLARLCLKYGKPAEALRAAQSAWERAAGDPENWLVLAAALGGNGRDEEALSLLERALQVRPGYAEALASRAMIQARGGRLAEAVADAERALSIKPHLTLLWALVANLRSQNRDLPGAVEALRKACELEPGNVTYMVELGEYLRRSGKVGEAISLFEVAVKIAPDNSNGWTNFGTALQ
jgi:protein O-GlcNAc transferase